MSAPGPATTTRRGVRPLRDAVVGGLVVFVVAALGLVVTYAYARQVQIEGVQRELREVAKLAASTIDVEAHERLDHPSKDGGPDYQRVVQPLAALHEATDEVYYLYTLIPRGTSFVYGVDSGAAYRRPGDTSVRLPLLDQYTVIDRDLFRAVETRTAQVTAETWSQPGLQFLSAYAPFMDAQGTVVGVVQVDMWVRALEGRLAGLYGIVRVAMAGIVVLAVASGVLLYRLRHAAAVARAQDRQALVDLAAARDAAEAASRGRSQFLGTMSHELRTPLNAILGYSELLLEDFEDLGDVEMGHDVSRIAAASRHLTAIIGDILDYTKLDDGRLMFAPSRVDLTDMLRDLVELLRPGATAKGLTLAIDIEPGADAAWADPVRLRQVLLNLVGNAIKFTERGGVTVRVRPCPLRAGRLACTVYDTGIGIPAEQRDRLFKPFSQVDPAGTRAGKGTGLGLIISRRLIEAMGGTLRFRSQAGRGSAFRVSLPVYAA